MDKNVTGAHEPGESWSANAHIGSGYQLIQTGNKEVVELSIQGH